MGYAQRARSLDIAVIFLIVLVSLVSPASRATASPNAEVSATYINPYTVYGASDARLDKMFAAQRKIGITTAIVQWTAYIHTNGLVGATYPPSAATKFSRFDTVLPRILASAKRHRIKMWLGLGVRPNIFDNPATMSSQSVFAHDRAIDRALAHDLLSRYSGMFVGWYLPSEVGYQTIASPSVMSAETVFLRAIASDLAKERHNLPTMISPSVPRAIEGGLSGVEFVDRLAPMIEATGITVWNFQDGFGMTAWTPEQNLAMFTEARLITAQYNVQAWGTLYTAGPGDPGTPAAAASLFADLDTVQTAKIPLTIYTFDSAMNPDPSRKEEAIRVRLYSAYSRRAA